MRRTKNRGAEPGQAVPALQGEQSLRALPASLGNTVVLEEDGVVLGLFVSGVLTWGGCSSMGGCSPVGVKGMRDYKQAGK